MKNILGGNPPAGNRCYQSTEDKICWYEKSLGKEVNGECVLSDDGDQCRCKEFNGESSVPHTDCIRPI